MITPQYVRVMAAYNAEMNDRLYGAADRLGDERRREGGGAFWASVHGTFSHLLWADRLWLSRFAGAAKPLVDIESSDRMYESFEQLSAERRGTDRAIVEWASTVDEAWLECRRQP